MPSTCLRKLTDVPRSSRAEQIRIMVYLLAHDIELRFYDHVEFFRVYVHIRKLNQARKLLGGGKADAI